MVTINREKCTGCGACLEICHESCMSLLEGVVRIDYALCSTCTQCIAICPASALGWDGVAPEPFERDRLPTSEQVDELLRQRRTVRHFKDDKPQRSVVEEILGYAAYAPTHGHDFRLIAVDDQEELERIDAIVYRYNEKLYRYLFKPRIMALLVKVIAPSHRREYLKARPKLEASLENGRGYASLPPVMVFVVGSKRVPLSLESAQYLLYNIDLYARTRGLGCRNLVGNQMFFNRSRKLHTTLGLARDEKIFATCGLGYPAKRFRNKVRGRALALHWCGGVGELTGTALPGVVREEADPRRTGVELPGK